MTTRGRLCLPLQTKAALEEVGRGWKCSECTLLNVDVRDKCTICDAPKPEHDCKTSDIILENGTADSMVRGVKVRSNRSASPVQSEQSELSSKVNKKTQKKTVAVAEKKLNVESDTPALLKRIEPSELQNFVKTMHASGTRITIASIRSMLSVSFSKATSIFRELRDNCQLKPNPTMPAPRKNVSLSKAAAACAPSVDATSMPASGSDLHAAQGKEHRHEHEAESNSQEIVDCHEQKLKTQDSVEDSSEQDDSGDELDQEIPTDEESSDPEQEEFVALRGARRDKDDDRPHVENQQQTLNLEGKLPDQQRIQAETNRVANNCALLHAAKVLLPLRSAFFAARMDAFSPFIESRLQKKLVTQPARLPKKMLTALATPPELISTTRGTMTSYQLAGMNWMRNLHSFGIGAILADEMGLGKSLQVIAFLASLKQNGAGQGQGPHLIVCPLSVLGTWMDEFRHWCPSLRIVKFHGNVDERARLSETALQFGSFDVVCTTYGMPCRCQLVVVTEPTVSVPSSNLLTSFT